MTGTTAVGMQSCFLLFSPLACACLQTGSCMAVVVIAKRKTTKGMAGLWLVVNTIFSCHLGWKWWVLKRTAKDFAFKLKRGVCKRCEHFCGLMWFFKPKGQSFFFDYDLEILQNEGSIHNQIHNFPKWSKPIEILFRSLNKTVQRGKKKDSVFSN